MQFSFEAAFALGYQIFKSRYPALLSVVGIYVLVMFGVGALHAVIDSLVMGILVNVFFSGVLATGFGLVGVQFVRGESPGVRTLFAGFRHYWPLVALSFLLGLLWLAGSVGMAVLFSQDFIPILVGVIAIVAFQLFFIVRLMIFAPLLCLDPRRRLGITESIKTSWRLSGPVFWPLLGLFTVLLVIVVSTLVLLVLPGILLGIPLSLTVWGAAYVLVTAETDDVSEAQAEA